MKGVIFILQMNQNDERYCYGGPGLHIDIVDVDKRHPGGISGGGFSTGPCAFSPPSPSSLTKIKSHNHLRKIKYDKINMLIFFIYKANIIYLFL